MGTTLPDSKENVNGAKNGVTRRNILRTGLWTALMGILGSQTVLAQDNAVAVVTKPQNVPGRTLETVAPQSWFAQAIAWLQTEIAALQDEFKKWNIDSKKMEELLMKLLLNEKVITTEVQKTLDIIFDKLGKTYKFLPDGDKRKAEIKNIWDTIIRIKSELLEWDNLIKAMRFICGLCWSEKFRGETSTINKSYFKWIVDFFDSTTWGMMDAITKYEGSFQAMPSQEIRDLKSKLEQMRNPISTDDLEPKKWQIIVKMQEKDKWGTISLNRWFGTLAKGSCKIEDWALHLDFNEARDGYAWMTDEIKIPDKSRKINLTFKSEATIKSGSMTPIYVIFIDEKQQTISDLALSKDKNTGIELPKWTAGLKICFGTLRNKATGNAKISEIKIDIK